MPAAAVAAEAEAPLPADAFATTFATSPTSTSRGQPSPASVLDGSSKLFSRGPAPPAPIPTSSTKEVLAWNWLTCNTGAGLLKALETPITSSPCEPTPPDAPRTTQRRRRSEQVRAEIVAEALNAAAKAAPASLPATRPTRSMEDTLKLFDAARKCVESATVSALKGEAAAAKKALAFRETSRNARTACLKTELQQSKCRVALMKNEVATVEKLLGKALANEPLFDSLDAVVPPGLRRQTLDLRQATLFGDFTTTWRAWTAHERRKVDRGVFICKALLATASRRELVCKAFAKFKGVLVPSHVWRPARPRPASVRSAAPFAVGFAAALVFLFAPNRRFKALCRRALRTWREATADAALPCAASNDLLRRCVFFRQRNDRKVLQRNFAIFRRGIAATISALVTALETRLRLVLKLRLREAAGNSEVPSEDVYRETDAYGLVVAASVAASLSPRSSFGAVPPDEADDTAEQTDGAGQTSGRFANLGRPRSAAPRRHTESDAGDAVGLLLRSSFDAMPLRPVADAPRDKKKKPRPPSATPKKRRPRPASASKGHVDVSAPWLQAKKGPTAAKRPPGRPKSAPSIRR
ncbi:hypothetical protein M885DRAFT_146830 [Pelagophyceae sp. CCMP2097]|nr:hypothetical protein M885DRAFT_146830 [Pelagophyceae sp. CCMP2097]